MTAQRAGGTARQATVRHVFRIILGAFLAWAGLSHLFWARQEFLAQVPRWLPLDGDFVVVASGIVEIALGVWLISGWRRIVAGWITAAFFVAVFPGNINQFVHGIDAFGLDSDMARGIRLVFQPVLVGWALWCTGAWRAWGEQRAKQRHAGLEP